MSQKLREPREGALAARAPDGEGDLARRTLRTVFALVAACVLLVGLLSVTAVALTSRLTASGDGDTAKAARAPEAAPAGKKPLSI